MAVETLIQFRRGAAATWVSANPTLSAGEPGYESDTGRVKMGDGNTAWNSLNYLGENLSDGDFSGNVDVGGDVVIEGNLTVKGNTTTVNSTEVSVDDINLILGDIASPTDVTADGGGLTLKGTSDKTFNWVDATDAWTSSEHMNLASGKSYYINGVSVLSSTAVGGINFTDILVDSDIGSTVQAYDADTAKYDDTTANFTGTLQNGGSNVVVDSDIGSTVQAYDADTAKYDDTTANFTGTLQNGGSDVVVDSDIGSTVQAYDVELAAIAGLTSAADKLPYFTGSGTASLATLSSFGRTLIDDANASVARSTLGVVIGTDVQAQDDELQAIAGLTSAANTLPYFTGSGTAALTNLSSFGRTLIDDANASVARSTLGVVIGTDVQAYDADTAKYDDTTANFTGTLQNGGSDVVVDSDIGSTVQAYDVELAAIAGLTSAADKLPYFTGSGTASLATFTTFGRSLVDDADASAARTTLGVVIGTDVQAYSGDLDTVSGLGTSYQFLKMNSAGTAVEWSSGIDGGTP